MVAELGNVYSVVNLDTTNLKVGSEKEIGFWLTLKIRLLMRGVLRKVNLGDFTVKCCGKEQVHTAWLYYNKDGSVSAKLGEFFEGDCQ